MCESMLSVLGPVFIAVLFMMTQKTKSSRVCLGSAGKSGWSVNCGEPSQGGDKMISFPPPS